MYVPTQAYRTAWRAVTRSRPPPRLLSGADKLRIPACLSGAGKALPRSCLEPNIACSQRSTLRYREEITEPNIYVASHGVCVD